MVCNFFVSACSKCEIIESNCSDFFFFFSDRTNNSHTHTHTKNTQKKTVKGHCDLPLLPDYPPSVMHLEELTLLK